MQLRENGANSIVCMVAAASTIPALLIAGSLPQPVVNNYYSNNTTNTTVYVNATYRYFKPRQTWTSCQDHHD